MPGFTYHCFPGFGDRYLAPESFEAILPEIQELASASKVGESVSGRPIYGLKLGRGTIRILMWSQMHGNESTTTRALLDLLLASGRDEEIQQLFEAFTLYLIPILNPDGAAAYTRNNANDVDLNRDAQARTQPEIQTLFSVFNSFKPHYCFNLHDQRTRYGVGQPTVPAAISFLAPTADPEKSLTPARKVAMKIIVEIAQRMREIGPLGIGRYDDTYNANCVGDTFVSLGVPSILFEAGFFPGDYQREKTRELVYQALLAAMDAISMEERLGEAVEAYFEIPENISCYADIVLKNSFPDRPQPDLVMNYEEELANNGIRFIPKILEDEYAEKYLGHTEFDLRQKADREKVMANPHLRRHFE